MKISFFLNSVAAGFPSPADDVVEKKLDLNELLIKHPAATFFVKVEGHSMQDAHIFSGDILIIDRSLQASSGSIVVAVINGEFTVKRLINKQNRLWLVAENKAYPAMEITPEMEFQIWGVVTYVIHKVCAH
jgi:DNA polymerase V